MMMVPTYNNEIFEQCSDKLIVNSLLSINLYAFFVYTLREKRIILYTIYFVHHRTRYKLLIKKKTNCKSFFGNIEHYIIFTARPLKIEIKN